MTATACGGRRTAKACGSLLWAATAYDRWWPTVVGGLRRAAACDGRMMVEASCGGGVIWGVVCFSLEPVRLDGCPSVGVLALMTVMFWVIRY
jgi:hypothetical protein